MRVLTGALALGLLITFAASPASADQVVVVNGLPDVSSNYFVGEADCVDATKYAPSSLGMFFPVTTDPSGDVEGSRMFGVDPTGSGGGFGPAVVVQSPSTNTVLTTRVDFPDAAGSGLAVVHYLPDGDTSDPVYVGAWTVSPAPAQGWSTVDASDVTYTWQSLSSTGVTSAAGTGTLASFVGTHTGTAPEASLALLFGCNGQSFNFDHFQYGYITNITTVDFESYTSTVAITGSKSKIVAGAAVTLDGAPSIVQYSPFTGSETVTLLAKPFGASTFTPVGTADSTYDSTTKSDLPAELVVHPKKNTSYEWQVPDDNQTVGSTSPVFTVKVATKITGKLADSTLSKGQTLSLRGKTFPHKVGRIIYLEKKKGRRWVKIAHVRVHKRGVYTLRTVVSSVGVWKVRAFLPAGGGNIAGHSPIRYAAVN
jgi:hypothetical protein